MKIEPTVGRVVWFYPDENSSRGKGHPGPLAAQIAAVNEDGTINLGVIDQVGVCFAAQNVPLVQDGEAAPENKAFAAWMPFQIGQAQKTEEAGRQAAADLDAKVDQKVDAAVDARFSETLKNIEAKFADAAGKLQKADEPQKPGGA